jgi:arylsulfatase A
MIRLIPIAKMRSHKSNSLPAYLVFAYVVAFAAVLVPTALAQAKPNIIIIFADDQGYEDIGCFGSPLIKTPNMDRMAVEGTRFTDFYSANSVCSPSRAALLTGSYPTRVSVPGVLFPRHSTGLSTKEITIADLLKTKGYSTAAIGKWHLGHKPSLLPTRQGFDSYFGIPYSNDMTIDQEAQLAPKINLREDMTVDRIRTEKPKKNWVPLMRDEQVVEYPADQTTLTKRYTEEALKFIESNTKEPFFLYFAHTMPHIPLFASEAFEGRSARGLYGDTIEEMDWSVGQILDSLKRHGLDKNTLVVYTSDNGPWKLNGGRGGSAYPLRGYKFSTYEGGMRVPCIMRWPGHIPSNKVCSEIAATIDLLPTIAHLSGAAVPSDRIIDGNNIWPLMAGLPNATTPHKHYFFYKGNNLQAVRSGKWKYRKDKNREELYNLSTDIRESTNVATQNPDVAKRLAKAIQKFDTSLKANQRPVGVHAVKN